MSRKPWKLEVADNACPKQKRATGMWQDSISAYDKDLKY